MILLYRCLMYLVQALLPVAGILLRSGKTAEFIRAQRRGLPPGVLPKSGRRYWFHCASLGEFEQARPLMEKLKTENPGISIVVSFFSPSGYLQKHSYELADAVLYLPLDSPRNADRVLQYLQPDTAIFIKYEIWYFYLRALHRHQIPVYLVSAVFRENQFLFGMAGKWLFNLLPLYRTIFVQDKNSLELLQAKGLQNVQLSGDTRYDRVRQHALSVSINERIKAFKGAGPMLVLGSSWPAEEALLLEMLKLPGHENLKAMIAPHDVSEAHIAELMRNFAQYTPLRYTGSEPADSSRILILDTIGHLASSYVYADIALIGGGFGKGLHNILEALAFGVPVAFGPDVERYPEAAWARESGVAVSLQTAAELSALLKRWLGGEHEQLRLKCTDFIHWHSGATEAVIRVLHKHEQEQHKQ